MLKERATRQKAFLKAMVRTQNGAVTMECTVRNISSTGAKIEISKSCVLPAEFELEIPQRNTVMHCHLIWRNDEAAGIRFEDKSSQEPIDPLVAAKARIEVLEKENETLKKEIGRLMAMLHA
jgi:hypothetical protein